MQTCTVCCNTQSARRQTPHTPSHTAPSAQTSQADRPCRPCPTFSIIRSHPPPLGSTSCHTVSPSWPGESQSLLFCSPITDRGYFWHNILALNYQWFSWLYPLLKQCLWLTGVSCDPHYLLLKLSKCVPSCTYFHFLKVVKNRKKPQAAAGSTCVL